jgi:uncharacterized SAM-binding protein YcdF (DUF218 family)
MVYMDMYRSVKIFEKQGIAVIPVPVDYQIGNEIRWGKFDLEMDRKTGTS